MSKVYFIGGIHGAGKTTLCKHMENLHDWRTVKQRHLVIDASGQDRNTPWEEIGQYHNGLIPKVADRLLKEIEGGKTLTLDCHYAIKQDKASRLVGREAASDYIPDLDPRLVDALGKHADMSFIYLDILPEVAHERCFSRHMGSRRGESEPVALEYENTIPGLRKQAHAESFYFHQLASKYRNEASNLILDGQSALNELEVQLLRT